MAETDPLTSQLKAAGVDRAEVLGRLTRSRLLRRAAIAVGVVVAVVLAIVELPGLHEVRARFAHADPGWILVAVVMEAASIACFTLALQRTFKERLALLVASARARTAASNSNVLPKGLWAT